MNTIALKQITIIQALSQLPEAKLDQVKIYLDELLGDDQRVPHQNQSLKGIWRDIGFENISNLEEEIQTARYALQDAILKRVI